MKDGSFPPPTQMHLPFLQEFQLACFFIRTCNVSQHTCETQGQLSHGTLLTNCSLDQGIVIIYKETCFLNVLQKRICSEIFLSLSFLNVQWMQFCSGSDFWSVPLVPKLHFEDFQLKKSSSAAGQSRKCFLLLFQFYVMCDQSINTFFTKRRGTHFPAGGSSFIHIIHFNF